MKILIYCFGDLTINRGSPIRICNVARELSKRNHKILVAAIKYHLNDSSPKILFLKLQEEKLKKIPLLRSIEKILSLRKILQAHKPDIILGVSLAGLFVPAITAKLSNIPLVVDLHSVAREEMRERWGILKYLFMGFAERLFLKKIAGVIFVSKKLKTYYSSCINENRVEVISGGVDTSRFNPMVAPLTDLLHIKANKAIVVGYIGNFYHYQGINYLIEAAKEVVKRNKKFVFLLVGAEKDSDIEKIKTQFPYKENIFVFGKKSYQNIPQYFALADILVIPRSSNPITENAFPGKFLECMAMGKAIIATDVGPASELLGNNERGILISPRRITLELVSAIFLLKNKNKRKQLGEKAYEYVRKNYEWDFEGEKLSRFLEKIAKQYRKR